MIARMMFFGEWILNDLLGEEKRETEIPETLSYIRISR